MNSANHCISGKQLNRMLILDILGVAPVIILRLLPHICGSEGTVLILVSGFFSVCMTLIYVRAGIVCERSAYAHVKKHRGAVMAFIFAVFFIVKFLISAGYILRMFTEVMQRTFLTEMSVDMLAILMILVAGYGVYKGAASRSRFSEIFMWFLVLLLIAMVMMSLFEIRIERLAFSPEFEDDCFFKAIYLCVSVFNVNEFLMFAIPYVGSGKGCGREQLYRFSISAVVCGVVMTALLYFCCIGVFSAAEASVQPWPAVTLMQMVRLPGHFVTRQDGLILVLWMGAVFILLSGYVFYADLLFEQICMHTRKKHLLIIFMVMTYILFLFAKNYEMYEVFYWKCMAFVGLPGSLCLALLVLVSDCAKREGNQHEN